MKHINTILQAAHREKPYQILNLFAHERYGFNLGYLPAQFYLVPGQNVRQWNQKYAPMPKNFFPLPNLNILDTKGFDFLLCENILAHFPIVQQLKRHLGIPVINVIHTMPPSPGWSITDFKRNQAIFDIAETTVFITEYSKQAWTLGQPGNFQVIEHGIDTKLFSPSEYKENTVMGVCNDFINRGNEHGYPIWQHITKGGIPINLWGDTPNLSKPANSMEHLITEYQRSKVFLHTAMWSPLSMSLMEAAACGCAVISTATCGAPDFFTSEENALLFSADDPDEGRKMVERVLGGQYEGLGGKAREMVVNRLSIQRFVKDWEELLESI